MFFGPSKFLRLTHAILCAVFLSVLAANSQGQESNSHHKRVLLVYNNDSATATQVMIDRALRSELRRSSEDSIEILTEYVGDTRARADYENEFLALVQKKYQDRKPDLIMAVTPSVLDLLSRNRSVLFGDVPIVYLSLDSRDFRAELHPGITQVSGVVSFEQNLEIALAQNPDAKRVIVVGGLSKTDDYWKARAQEEFRKYESRLEFRYVYGLTIPEMRSELAALTPDSIVFFVTAVRDRLGNTFESPDYLRQIESASPVPIYGTTEGQFGNGIIGGQLVSFEALGAAGGKVGLRLLAGENQLSLQPQIAPNRLLFDWRQMQRFGISEASLPAGSIIRFKDPTLWEEYKWYIVGLALLLTGESLLIGFLVYLRYRRRQAEAEALELHGRLKDIVSNVPGIVWESRSNPLGNGRTTTFISDYVQKMLGYSTEEWLQQPPGFGLTIIPEEERERVKKESDDVIATGSDSVSEFRWHTKDGATRWVENHIAPIVDEKKGIVGLRGVALDVTDRKQAEEKGRAILAAIPDIMFVQTKDGVYLDYHAKNPGELLVPPESFLGKNMSEVLPQDLAEGLGACFERLKADGTPQIHEYTIQLENSTHWFEARIVRTGENILSVIRDITDLKLTQLEAQEISGRLIRAQEDERSHLARELHDDACQKLALVSIELELLRRVPLSDGETIDAKIRMLSDSVAELASDLRQMSHQLHPARLERLGLASAVQGFCREIESAHKITVDFQNSDLPSVLPMSTALNVYRIIQEALHNVVKHSGATHASVTLSADDSKLMLTVSDNGRGFEPERTTPKGSLGIVNMRERARLLRGTISTTSNPDEGTRIEATFPVPNKTVRDSM